MSLRNVSLHSEVLPPKGVEEIVQRLKGLFRDTITPQMESALRKVSEPVLRDLERLLNLQIQGTQEKVLKRFFEMMSADKSRFESPSAANDSTFGTTDSTVNNPPLPKAA